MFDNLFVYAKELHGEMVQIYWIMLPAIVALLLVFELLKGADAQPNVNDILRRTVISILLLLSFATVVNTIAMVSDGITAKIDQSQSLWEAIKHLGPDSQGESGSLFDMRGHVIYFFAIGAYLIAYIGFFASVALMNFVWAVLYVCAPLMILCYVPRATAGIVSNLYRGLISVATWKILWTLLGSLLLKLAVNPKVAGVDDYILSMVMNLLIGLSMLLIPLFTRSLIGDGLQSAASTLAAAPGLMAAKAAILSSKLMGKKIAGGVTGFTGFASKPITNPVTGRGRVLASKVSPKVKDFKNWYSEVGLPEEAKELNKKERRKQFAIERSRRK
jgi:hypothetical protein